MHSASERVWKLLPEHVQLKMQFENQYLIILSWPRCILCTQITIYGCRFYFCFHMMCAMAKCSLLRTTKRNSGAEHLLFCMHLFIKPCPWDIYFFGKSCILKGISSVGYSYVLHSCCVQLLCLRCTFMAWLMTHSKHCKKDKTKKCTLFLSEIRTKTQHTQNEQNKVTRRLHVCIIIMHALFSSKYAMHTKLEL